MLLHIDGSRHQWFQDERWYDLIVILDDATSEIYGDRLRHQRRPGGREGRGAQPPTASGGDRRDLGLGRLHPRQDAADVAGQSGARGGGAHAAAGALDQRRSDLSLERGDRLRHRRLRVGESVCGV